MEFIYTELSKQVQAGHVTVSPLEAVNYLHTMWLSPVTVIPQKGRRPRLIFDFTWIRLNDILKRLSPMDAMIFGGALQRILKQVLTAETCLGPVYLSRVELVDAYMRMWVRMEDVPSVAFLVTNKNPATHSWWYSI